jgi:hypothetical protein
MAKIAIAMTWALLGVAANAHAAESPPKPAHFYRVDLAVYDDANGKTVSVRRFSLNVQDRDTGRVQVGSNLPMPSGTGAGAVARQDVGTKVTSLVEERDGRLIVRTSFEMQRVAGPEGKLGPVTRKVIFDAVNAIAPGKAAVVGSADDDTGHTFRLEVTVTRID